MLKLYVNIPIVKSQNNKYVFSKHTFPIMYYCAHYKNTSFMLKSLNVFYI